MNLKRYYDNIDAKQTCLRAVFKEDIGPYVMEGSPLYYKYALLADHFDIKLGDLEKTIFHDDWVEAIYDCKHEDESKTEMELIISISHEMYKPFEVVSLKIESTVVTNDGFKTTATKRFITAGELNTDVEWV